MRPRGTSRPKTPAERQAKCRAVKRGEWHTIAPLPPNWSELPEYAHLLAAEAKPAAQLPAPPKKELPGPTKGTAIQKPFSSHATALAPLDADGAGAGAGAGDG